MLRGENKQLKCKLEISCVITEKPNKDCPITRLVSLSPIFSLVTQVSDLQWIIAVVLNLQLMCKTWSMEPLSNLWVSPQVQKFSTRGTVVALIAAYVVPNFWAFGDPYKMDDITLYANVGIGPVPTMWGLCHCGDWVSVWPHPVC